MYFFLQVFIYNFSVRSFINRVSFTNCISYIFCIATFIQIKFLTAHLVSHLLSYTVSEGQEYRGGLAVGICLKVSFEITVSLWSLYKDAHNMAALFSKTEYLWFNKSSKWFLWMLRFENHWPVGPFWRYRPIKNSDIIFWWGKSLFPWYHIASGNV